MGGRACEGWGTGPCRPPSRRHPAPLPRNAVKLCTAQTSLLSTDLPSAPRQDWDNYIDIIVDASSPKAALALKQARRGSVLMPAPVAGAPGARPPARRRPPGTPASCRPPQSRLLACRAALPPAPPCTLTNSLPCPVHPLHYPIQQVRAYYTDEGYSSVYNPGGPGRAPTPGVAYSTPAPPQASAAAAAAAVAECACCYCRCRRG